jgi:hypothetical protein
MKNPRTQMRVLNAPYCRAICSPLLSNSNVHWVVLTQQPFAVATPHKCVCLNELGWGYDYTWLRQALYADVLS